MPPGRKRTGVARAIFSSSIFRSPEINSVHPTSLQSVRFNVARESVIRARLVVKVSRQNGKRKDLVIDTTSTALIAAWNFLLHPPFPFFPRLKRNFIRSRLRALVYLPRCCIDRSIDRSIVEAASRRMNSSTFVLSALLSDTLPREFLLFYEIERERERDLMSPPPLRTLIDR